MLRVGNIIKVSFLVLFVSLLFGLVCQYAWADGIKEDTYTSENYSDQNPVSNEEDEGYLASNGNSLNGVVQEDESSALIDESQSSLNREKAENLSGDTPEIKSNSFNGWINESGQWFYFNQGEYLIGWQKIKNDWYYLDPEDGHMWTGWQTIDGKMYYLTPGDNGSAKTGWQKIDNQWYYFDSKPSCAMLTGWQKIKNDWYYLDPENGHMWTGWQTIDGKMYYLTPGDNGSAKTGWQKIDNQWYYFDSKPSCAMLTGWQKIKNDWYYLDPEDGHMWTGLQQIENKWYYLTPGDNGSAKTGWQEIDGKWYYFSAKPSCAALTGWQTIDEKRYYFDPDNAYMYVGRQEIDGKEYLFDSEGRAFIDTWVDWEGERIYADEMGRLLYIWVSDSESGGVFLTDLESNKLFGWIICGNKRYYADQKTGLLLSQSSILDGQWYEFNEDYTLKTGWTKRSDDYWYFLGDDGLPETGWVKVDGYWYYLDLSDGHMLTGWQKIDGYWHYLKPGDSGRMLTGWQWIDGHWYYFMTGDSGRMLTGWQWIDGQWYYFSSSGALIEGGDMAIKAQGYSSGTNYLILVDCSSHKVGVFHGSQNNWSLQYSWSCVTGAPATPTIKGTFHTTGFKRGSLSTDSRAIWCTQISGGYFFHSILASESELGNSLSHGCIRLPYTAAQWIYNNIYAGTTVVIYE